MGGHLLLPLPQEKRRSEQPETAVRCPRCNSGDTKFCYYNNYSLSQPRHFCKTCRRYWTRGGTLRNVPVGGSSRKNRRQHSSFSSSKKARLHRPLPPSAGGGAFFVGSPSSSSDPPGAPTFLDILRNRFLENSAGEFGDLCDGFHDGAAAPLREGFAVDGGEGPSWGFSGRSSTAAKAVRRSRSGEITGTDLDLRVTAAWSTPTSSRERQYWSP
ncbi:unnamed protein product [Spirodela intermedia]|uniref:Dof zinc finger protein n=1 Tax=Spirodela intermedia TaxID=51605 RepID=A0A7I8IG68_SPIIN|nr:unnamed protein product [Spirodela intermedia]CAA6656868.1 unnamed protein product [Spirodela intermedia]